MQPLITNTNNFSNIIQTSSKVINEIPVKKPVIKKYTKINNMVLILSHCNLFQF
jgi:hypothetical protein